MRNKGIQLGVLLAAMLLVAVVLVPSMGANPNVGPAKSEKALDTKPHLFFVTFICHDCII